MLSKKQLAIMLSQMEKNKYPKPKLEQYEIPGELAAEIINQAHLSGDVKDKIILDLGCGSGRLGIGCALMGAKKVVCVDVDESVLRTAKENMEFAEKKSGKKLENKITFIHSDASDWIGKVDTVIQNPPFGIQKEHADRIFLKKALKSGKKIYSLHRSFSKSRDFLTKLIEDSGGKVQDIIKYKFRLPHTFEFHEKPSVEFDVDLYVIDNCTTFKSL